VKYSRANASPTSLGIFAFGNLYRVRARFLRHTRNKIFVVTYRLILPLPLLYRYECAAKSASQFRSRHVYRAEEYWNIFENLENTKLLTIILAHRVAIYTPDVRPHPRCAFLRIKLRGRSRCDLAPKSSREWNGESREVRRVCFERASERETFGNSSFKTRFQARSKQNIYNLLYIVYMYY